MQRLLASASRFIRLDSAPLPALPPPQPPHLYTSAPPSPVVLTTLGPAAGLPGYLPSCHESGMSVNERRRWIPTGDRWPDRAEPTNESRYATLKLASWCQVDALTQIGSWWLWPGVANQYSDATHDERGVQSAHRPINSWSADGNRDTADDATKTYNTLRVTNKTLTKLVSRHPAYSMWKFGSKSNQVAHSGWHKPQKQNGAHIRNYNSSGKANTTSNKL